MFLDRRRTRLYSVIAIPLLVFIAQVRAKELDLKHTRYSQDSLDKWLDILVARAYNARPLQHSDLDTSTLAKLHPDKSQAAPYMKHSLSVPRSPFPPPHSPVSFFHSPFPVPSSQFPIPRSQRIPCAGSSSKDQDFALCRVAIGLEPVSGPRVPVWLFRQAGRHLPEYNEFKAQQGKSFQQLLDDPADVAEVAMQPLRRYGVDAAILFSDILVVAEALGVRYKMSAERGLEIPNPLAGPEDLARLPKVDEAATPAFIEKELGLVLDAVRKILEQMQKEGFGSRPLIGFSAAPWTLLFFMVGSYGKGKRDIGERWLKEHKAASNELLSLLTQVVIEYLSAQVSAGCHVLQVFEAMGDYISEENFREFALPTLVEIAQKLRSRHPDVPLMVFPKGHGHALADLQTAGYDVITADTSTDLRAAAQALREEAERSGSGRVATLQGNFDPRWLRVADGGTPEAVRREVRLMLEASGALGTSAGGPRLIANLGEALSGKESPELVAEFVNAVHEMSSATSA